MAAVTEHDTAAGVGDLVQRLCRFAVDEMGLSGCALVLMSEAEPASVLAGAGRHARTVTGLQMELGEGPCLHAHASGIPVLLPDLSAENANRWPAFAAAALAVGVHAEFSLPLTLGPGGIGTFDLCRDIPAMLGDEHLAGALVDGRPDDVAREAMLARAFVRLADTLASDFDIVDFLHGLAEDSVEILRAAAAGWCWPTRTVGCG
jgi:GAF domain